MATTASKWDNLIFGTYSADVIKKYVDNPTWQKFRKELKGTSLDDRYNLLQEWLMEHNNSRAAKVQVTNYVNALKRGGMI